jgi:hypothetical protein
MAGIGFVLGRIMGFLPGMGKERVRASPQRGAAQLLGGGDLSHRLLPGGGRVACHPGHGLPADLGGRLGRLLLGKTENT